MNTTRLYYEDAELLDFAAQLVEVADEARAAYLDRTAFYPTSGGQLHDTGTLDGLRVIDVIDEGDRIRHVLDRPLERQHGEVKGSVDPDRRRDHMQQHTGQHVLSAVFEDLFGYATASVHFGTEHSTLDLATESVSREQLVRAEELANAVVGENRPVVVTFEDAATAPGLRKASDREGTIRIVSIADLDRSACGGTHLSSTGAIGPVLLRSTERIRKTTRIGFLCGARALRAARRDHDRLSAIAASLSASIDEAERLVAAQSDSLREAEQRARRLERELAGHRARELYDRTDPIGGGRRIVVLDTAGDMEDLRTLARAIVAFSNAVVIGVVAEPPSMLLATADDTGLDAGKLLREALQSLGGRGGGSPRMAQGSLPSADLVSRAIPAIRALVA